jgi:putative membrane protein
LWLGAEDHGIKIFFLGCVIVAGVYGALSASRKILFIQGLPGLLALLLVLFSGAGATP